MSVLRPKSLQLRLALRLGALFLVATILMAGAFFYVGSRTADALSHRDLFQQADDLADTLDDDPPFLKPVDQLIERGVIEPTTAFVIRDRDGELLASSDENFVVATAGISTPWENPRYFQLASFGSPAQVYSGLATRERSELGRVSVLVAGPYDAEDALLDAMLDEIALNTAWIIPVFVAITLVVGVVAIRRGLQPLRETARQAEKICPDSMSVRLDTGNLPSEVAPVVTAVNLALDRLEEGFAVQRRFTANAAHELRTPLAIITGALENQNDQTDLGALRQDVKRMNRLVHQLLQVARLDGIALDVSGEFDLQSCARNVVECMAPLAISHRRSLALVGACEPVVVRGNCHAVEDAIRNLVENALLHTPEGSEVQVSVSENGIVEVRDQGKGIDSDQQRYIFDRFWRDASEKLPGAGLGLAIVAEVMKQHDGKVEVENQAEGGALFRLRFAPAIRING